MAERYLAETGCAALADQRGDSLVATAPPAERWLLIESRTPWPRNALTTLRHSTTPHPPSSTDPGSTPAAPGPPGPSVSSGSGGTPAVPGAPGPRASTGSGSTPAASGALGPSVSTGSGSAPVARNLAEAASTDRASVAAQAVLGAEVARLCAQLGYRPVLIRRYGRIDRSAPRRWGLVDCRPGRESVRWGVLPSDEHLLEVLRGSDPGEISHEPVYLVCTHGRHDACCAVRGRPVAAALAAAYPERTWECSHVGGDRFAANVVVLPHGLFYGHVPASRAVELAKHYDEGLVVPDLLRGSGAFIPPVQAAQHYARAAGHSPALDNLLPTSVRQLPNNHWHIDLATNTTTPTTTAPTDTSPPPDISPTHGEAPTPDEAPTPSEAPMPGAAPTTGAAPRTGAAPTTGVAPTPSERPTLGAAPTTGAAPTPSEAPMPGAAPTAGAAPRTGAVPAAGAALAGSVRVSVELSVHLDTVDARLTCAGTAPAQVRRFRLEGLTTD